MGHKAKVIKGILFKAAGFFLAGVLVSMALLTDTSTLAWFSSRVAGSIQVQAASGEDIIEDFYTLSGGSRSSRNPDTIVVKKAPNMKGNMIVYFSLDEKISGKNSGHGLAGYMLHLNPIEIKDNGQGEFRAQIEMKFNWRDLVYLWDNFDKTESGTLTLRYLNGFVIKEYPVTFDNGYLWSRAVASLTGMPDMKYAKKNKDDLENQMNAYIAQIIADLAQSVHWNQIISSGRTALFSASIMAYDDKTAPEQASDQLKTGSVTTAAMARARMNGVVNPFERIQLTGEQQSIVDIVAPGLTAYIENIYNFVEELIARLNEKMAEIDKLNLAIDGMNAQIQGLNAAIDDLTQKYTALEQEKAALLEEKMNLEQDNMKLKAKIDDLKDEIDSLIEKNAGLKDEIKDLELRNTSLEQEIQKMKDENDNLRKEIENLKHSSISGGSGNTSSGGSGAPSDEIEPPAGTQPPSAEPPDGGFGDTGTVQPPTQEAGEQPPAGQEPAVEEPGAPSSGGKQPVGNSTQQDSPSAKSQDGLGNEDSIDSANPSGGEGPSLQQGASGADSQKEQAGAAASQENQPSTQQDGQDVLIAP
ncbi:MAG: hypothetical protein NUV45_05310 [Tepidanaerobacteraceae bacterium]|nr:hypothetical protein [Tepidanaerobacteraceae bacterium]